MKKRKVLLFILSFIIGAVFVFSAYSKTSPISYFEYTISSQAHLPQHLSAILARVFIGLEGGLGLLIAFNIYGFRKWVIKACVALLAVFSVYLAYLLITQGNDVNCGCMGNVLPMSPGISLLKNMGLLAGLIVLLKWNDTEDGPILDFGSIVLTAILVAVSFFLFPMKDLFTMPISKLYTTTTSEHPVVELRKGKHILCFMSLSCKYCREAAKAVAKMKKNNPQIPFYFALASGSDSTRAERFHDFLEDTKATDIPYHFMGEKDFISMVQFSHSEGIPVLLMMQDTTVIRKLTTYDLNQKELENWIKQ